MQQTQFPKSISLADLPTPLVKLGRLSESLGGPEIYLKHDDFTGSEISGNKVRKLEFSVAEALRQGANMLITCGGIQSNHCRATAAAATKLGIKSCLILRGTPPEPADGNYLLDILLGAKVKFVTPEQYSNEIEKIFLETKKDLEKEGYKPYIIPEGASNGIGTFGYAKAMQEIVQQEKKMGITFNKILTAVGSGGTHAGLFLGTKLFAPDKEIYGVNVCDDEEYFVNKIERILKEANEYLQKAISFARNDIHILDGYVGPGYGLNTPEHIDTIKMLAAEEGIILDPVYTGKAMHGLLEEINKGKVFSQDDRILFIHTGGQYGLFPVKERF